MVHESVTLNAFESGVNPKAHCGDDPCPHHMPTHLKKGVDAVEQGQRIVVYALNSGSPWYIFEKVPFGKEWNKPGDGIFVGSTSRRMRERLNCQSDSDCIRSILANNEIPLMAHPIYIDNTPQALSLVKEPDYTRWF